MANKISENSARGNGCYEINLDWLKMIMEQNHGVACPPIKWVKQISLVDQNNVVEKTAYSLMVLHSGSYKNWIEIRPSGISQKYGVFAVSRFEKGSIITCKMPSEDVEPNAYCVPTDDTSVLQLGWKWIVKKESGVSASLKGCNAVYVEQNGLVRASSRIMPGGEIIIEGNNQVSESHGLHYLDLIVARNKNNSNFRRGFMNRESLGTVISGDISRGFCVKFNTDDPLSMTAEEVKRSAVRFDIGIESAVKKRKFENNCNL
jgi:hypothetical protein